MICKIRTHKSKAEIIDYKINVFIVRFIKKIQNHILKSYSNMILEKGKGKIGS